MNNSGINMVNQINHIALANQVMRHYDNGCDNINEVDSEEDQEIDNILEEGEALCEEEMQIDEEPLAQIELDSNLYYSLV